MSVLLGSGRQRAGKKSRVLCGNATTPLLGTALAYASFNYSVDGDDLPTPNMNSFNITVLGVGPGISITDTAPQTFDEGILGIIRSKFDFGGDWDAGFNAFDPPPGIYPRDDFPGLVFDQNRLDPGICAYPYSRLRNTRVGSTVTGKVTFTADGMNQGPFNVPSGSNTTVPDNG